MPAKRKKKPTRKVNAKSKCTPERACKYCKEWDYYWKNEILPKYIKLQRAVCHLERVVFDGRAVDPALRRCSGAGGGVEPNDPPPPPNW